MKFLNKNKFPLNNTNGRYFHLATIEHGVREFMCFVDRSTGKIFIEEITGGHLDFIEDDQLANALSEFCTMHGILNANQPFIPDEQWHKMKPKDEE
jgi:hypothetical protein